MAVCLRLLCRHDIPSKVPLSDTISVDELAEQCALDKGDLSRVLRCAQAWHLFQEPVKGQIGHTAASRLLKEDERFKAWITNATEQLWPSVPHVRVRLQLWMRSLPYIAGRRPDQMARLRGLCTDRRSQLDIPSMLKLTGNRLGRSRMAWKNLRFRTGTSIRKLLRPLLLECPTGIRLQDSKLIKFSINLTSPDFPTELILLTWADHRAARALKSLVVMHTFPRLSRIFPPPSITCHLISSLQNCVTESSS